MQTTSVTITIDVEEDMPGWQIPAQQSIRNVYTLPRLQALAERFGVPPTYLCTFPMVTNSASSRVLEHLAASGLCELGAHLHPWNTPPFDSIGPSREALRATQIPLPTVAARLSTLTTAMTQRFGKRPTSIRMGRFGIDGRILMQVELEGYLVDSSVTPGMSWAEEGGPDHQSAPVFPYFPCHSSVTREGRSAVLEVPVSAGFTRRIPTFLQKAYFRIPRATHLRGLLSSEMTSLLDFAWLSPWRRSAKDLIQVSDVLLEQGVPILTIFFHSSELWPGASGFAQTHAEVETYYQTLTRLLEHLMVRRGCVGRTLTGFRNAYLGLDPARGAS